MKSFHLIFKTFIIVCFTHNLAHMLFLSQFEIVFDVLYLSFDVICVYFDLV